MTLKTTLRTSGSGRHPSGVILSLDDDVRFGLGTDSADQPGFPDIAMVLNSAGLAANAELAGVIVGTSIYPVAIPAASLIISNITNDGDIVFFTATGGNSIEAMRIDGSARTVIVSGVNGIDINPGSDTDTDLLTVGDVSGFRSTTPRFFWDAAGNVSFSFNDVVAVEVATAVTNATAVLLDLVHNTSGTPANGFGIELNFQLDDDGGADSVLLGGAIISRWKNFAGLDAELIFQVTTAAGPTVANALTIDGELSVLTILSGWDLSIAGTVEFQGSQIIQSTSGVIVFSGNAGHDFTTAIEMRDGTPFRLGSEGDVAFLLRAGVLAADAEVSGVIEGTSNHQGTAANSLLAGNITDDGDIMFLISDGGNSLEFLRADGDVATVDLGFGMLITKFMAASTVLIEGNGTGLGFFATTPAAQPTGVAVTEAAIHAALVTLGLITA